MTKNRLKIFALGPSAQKIFRLSGRILRTPFNVLTRMMFNLRNSFTVLQIYKKSSCTIVTKILLILLLQSLNI